MFFFLVCVFLGFERSFPTRHFLQHFQEVRSNASNNSNKCVYCHKLHAININIHELYT